MGFGKSKSDKKKGPKGKKARAKAKLDRRWGETTIQDDENQTRRIGKSRLLAKSQDRSSVRFGEKSTERQKVQTSSTGILRNREGSKEQTYYSSRKRHDDDDSSFSDSDNDSDLEIEITPLSNLLSSIKQSSKKKGKSKKGERTNFDPESDDEEAEMEEDNSGEDEMEEDEESLSENGETENLDNGVEIDDDDDDADDDSVLVTENGVGGDREPALDLFRQRFSSIAMSESELENASPLTTKIPIERSHELHLSTLSKEKSDIFLDGLLPTSKNSKRSSGEWQEITEQSFSGNRKVLQRQWKRVNKTKLMTDHQASIYPFLTRYTDLLVTTESRKVGSHHSNLIAP